MHLYEILTPIRSFLTKLIRNQSTIVVSPQTRFKDSYEKETHCSGF
jgi:hypothetical protein